MAAHPRILVSACLMGQPVRYDGQAKPLLAQQLDVLCRIADLFPFCPELAGGLPVPRAPAEIVPGGQGEDVLAGSAKILDAEGTDLTAPFINGAQLAMQFARKNRCSIALLMENSPSCGSFQIYSGHHDGQKRAGMGAATAALRAVGVVTYASDQADLLIKDLTGRSGVTQRSG